MSNARIAPVDPPYSAEMQADFDKVMRGAPPLALFRTIGQNPRVLSRLIAGGLLDKGSISIRQRELMILRTTALCGAEYEWGVHVAAFGAKCAWTPTQVRASKLGTAEESCWSADEKLVIRLADSLHATQHVDDALWAELAAAFRDDQLIELIMLAGLYHAVSCIVNATRVQPEKSAPRFPQS
jgi:alkylhydroperoxidase family enzyme